MTVRTMLICLLALAVMGFRAPVNDPSGLAQFATVATDHHSDRHGHSHGDEEEASSPSGHDHDRLHIGDHSHDTPSAVVLTDFRFASPRLQGPGKPDERIASRPTQPGDRPPRQA